jgi:hypothetical protein
VAVFLFGGAGAPEGDAAAAGAPAAAAPAKK